MAIELGVLFLDVHELKYDAARYLITYQNKIQREFEFSTWEVQTRWLPPVPDGAISIDACRQRAENALVRLEREAMESAADCDVTLPNHWLVITETELRGGFYFVEGGSAGGKYEFSILTLAQWKGAAPPSVLEFILASVAAAAIDVASENSISSHYATKGCLYDYNDKLADAKFSVLTATLCATCRSKVEECGADVSDAIGVLLDRRWLGSVDVVTDPAAVVKRRFHYSLYLTTGLKPSMVAIVYNKLTESVVSEIGKQLVIGLVLLFGIIWTLTHTGVTVNVNPPTSPLTSSPAAVH